FTYPFRNSSSSHFSPILKTLSLALSSPITNSEECNFEIGVGEHRGGEFVLLRITSHFSVRVCYRRNWVEKMLLLAATAAQAVKLRFERVE
ncbi:hypothetical protein V2J09_011542, partial [Rumex salicifolius]